MSSPKFDSYRDHFFTQTTPYFWSSSPSPQSTPALYALYQYTSQSIYNIFTDAFYIRPVRDFGNEVLAGWVDNDTLPTMWVKPVETTTYNAIVIYGKDTLLVPGTALVKPAPVLEIEEPDAALCIGTELTLTAHLRTPAIPNYNYTWGGDTPLEPGEVTNTEDTFTTVNTTIPASPGTYRFYVSMQNQSGDCKASDTVTVIAKDFSTLPITTDEWVCPEEVVTLSGITSAATAEQIYRWYDSDWNLIKTDTLPAGTPSTYITEPVTSPATYYLSAYDANSCAWDPLFMPLIEYQPLHTPVAATDTLNFTSDKNGLTTTLDATDRIAFFDEGGINGNISTSIPAENAWTHTFKTSEGQVEIHFHTFQVFDMNGNYGTIRVFDGMSATGVPLLTMDAPQSNIVVKSTSGSLTVQWYKKHSGSGESGWNADITVSSPIYHASEAHVGLKDPSECLLSSLIVQSNDCTLLYNAQEQTCEYYTVTYGDVTVPECTSCPAVPGTHYYILPTGDTVTVFDPISVRDVTDTVNGFEVIIQNSGNYSDIDTIYGNVKVIPIPLIITTDSDSKEYDGTPLTDDGWLDTPPVGLAPGDTVIFVDNHGTITEPGESFNYATTAIVVNTISGDTVTGNYDINYVFGILRVTPSTQSLIVQSNDCTLLYNAQEQTCEYYTVTYGDVTVPECTSCPAVPGTHYYILPTGDTVTVFDPISVRDVTDTVNGFEVIIQNSGNYSDIDTIYGNVKVIPIPLIITTDSDSKEYDGTPLTDDGWLDTPPVGLAPGDTVIFVDNHGTITEPGESFNYATTAIVVNTISGDTVTGNYDINYVFGTLTIYPPMNVLPINELVHVSCHGANDGRWTLVVSGGKPGVRTYTLDGGASVTLSDDTIRLTNLTPGNHQLVVTNVLGTTITIDFIVNEPDPLGVAVVVPINVADRCPNQGAYEVSAFVTGGTQPYSFEWSGDASSVNNNTTIVNQLGANDCNVEYMAVVLVNDFNFCEARDTARFTVLDTVKPTFTVPDSIAICRTQPSGSFDASPSVTGFPSSLNDNCTPAAQLFVTFRDEDTTGTEPGARLIMRKWTVKDACGNSITKTQKILIKPQTTHATITFTCPPDTNVILAYGACDTLLGIGNPSFTTDFSDMDYTITHDAPVDSIYSTGTTVVTWTLTDECGFSTHCQQNVEVVYPPCGTPADSVWDWNNIAYSSVRIGCQCWTGENLRSEHYSDGTPIPNHTRYMDNDSLEMVYGKLYSWYSAARVGEGDDSSVPADSMSFFGPYVQGICPAGWALPTVAEYWEMYNASGGHAGLVKSPSTLVWLPGREGTAPNLFEAFGAGYYDDSIQRYQNLLGETRFWAADYTTGSSMAKVFTLNYYCEDGQIVESRKGLGYSIRCIRKK